ncbi:hypothetical protein GCM10027423_43270 [Spirosoma arcticum]
MKHVKKTDVAHQMSDIERFYILMEPLYGSVDPGGSDKLAECTTEDEVRQEIAKRAANVTAALRRAGLTCPNGEAGTRPAGA